MKKAIINHAFDYDPMQLARKIIESCEADNDFLADLILLIVYQQNSDEFIDRAKNAINEAELCMSVDKALKKGGQIK